MPEPSQPGFFESQNSCLRIVHVERPPAQGPPPPLVSPLACSRREMRRLLQRVSGTRVFVNKAGFRFGFAQWQARTSESPQNTREASGSRGAA